MSLLSTKNGIVSKKGNRIEKTSVRPWTCNTRGNTGWSNGVHAWSVTLETGPEVSLGICRENIHETNCERNNDKRIDIYCMTGDVVGIGNNVWLERCFDAPLKKGDTLTFLLNMDCCKLSVAKNGKWLQKLVVPMGGVPEGVWYPYVCIETKGCSVCLEYCL